MFSEAEISTSSLRVDAEFFSKKYLADTHALSKKSPVCLSTVANKIDVGFVGSMAAHYCDVGIPLLQTKNIMPFFVEDIETIKIPSKFHHELAKSKIAFEDVLIARSGSFGKASIYLKSQETNSSDIIIIQVNKASVNPYFLTAFLNSPLGINQMIRFASGGLQGHVNLTILEELKVPLLKDGFQVAIEYLINLAYQKKDLAITRYNQAETLLLETLGLTNFKPSTEQINIKSFKDSFGESGRLDAEYYQPKYEEFERLVIQNPNSFSSIESEFELIKSTTDRALTEYDYIEIGDVNTGDGTSTANRLLVDELPDNAKIQAKRGDLIISKVRPNRGAVSIIECDDSRLVVSGAFTVLREKPYATLKKETLKVLLRLDIYREWMLKFNVGTQYPVIRDEDILNLPVPKIDMPTQQKIATQIQTSFALKAESERLLEVAKRAVEIAIEQDEQAGLEFIAQQTK